MEYYAKAPFSGPPAGRFIIYTRDRPGSAIGFKHWDEETANRLVEGMNAAFQAGIEYAAKRISQHAAGAASISHQRGIFPELYVPMPPAED